MTAVTAVLVGLTVFAGRPPERWILRSRLGMPVGGSWRPPSVVVVASAAAVAVPGVVGLGGPRVVLALTVAGVGVFVVRQLQVSRRRMRIRRHRLEVADLIGLMAAELRAGVLPAHVLAGLVTDFPLLAPAARAADVGGDVPAALRASADAPGREVLADLAGAWFVAERAGAPLATVLERLEEASRSAREVEREVEAGLAPARATGRLMAVLPAVGLMLGSGMGGDPVGVLMGTWVGVLCLASGVALACAGVAWVEKIATSVERDL